MISHESFPEETLLPLMPLTAIIAATDRAYYQTNSTHFKHKWHSKKGTKT